MIKKLEIKNINKSFVKDGEKFSVLKNMKFHVLEGEILCILGPSGCGKSTLLRQIAGFDKPDSGEILLNGEKISKADVNRMMVFQDFQQLLPWKTVLENVVFPMKINKIGKSPKERENMAKKYLSMAEMEGCDKQYPYQLSGGMKQKVAIARALALKPEVLLMDEPFASLDAQTRANLQNVIIDIWKNTGVTIVFITHDIQEALLISDRIIVLGKGDGKIKEVVVNQMDKPRVPGDISFVEMWKKIYSLLA